MSWLQAFELGVPHYDLREGKFVFALALQPRRGGRSRRRNARDSPRVTAVRSYSEFRKLWKDLLRATRTPNALSAATSALAGDGKAALARRSRRTRSLPRASSSAGELSSGTSVRPTLSSRSSSIDNDDDRLTLPSGVGIASGCLCNNFCCPFDRLHPFLKAYRFPSKFIIKKSTQAMLDARRDALEQFLSDVRSQFDQFPHTFLQAVEATDRCSVLELLAVFVGLSPEVRANLAPIRPAPLNDQIEWKSNSSVHPLRGNNNEDNQSQPKKVEDGPEVDNQQAKEAEADSDNQRDDTQSSPHSFGFVPQLSVLQEETVDENGVYVDGSTSATTSFKSQKADNNAEADHVREPEHVALETINQVAVSLRERADTMSKERRRRSTPPQLPKLQVRSTKVSPIRNFLDDFRDHLQVRRRSSTDSVGPPVRARHHSFWEVDDSVRALANNTEEDETRQWEFALYVAAQIGHVHAVRTILRRGTDANASAEDGLSSLHVACRGGHREVVELLLTAGAKVDTMDVKGMTPLLSAIHFGDLELVNRLLAAGADVNLCNVNRVSAAHVAVACQALPMLAALLANGAAINTANAFNGKTPLHIAAELGNMPICELLLLNGGDPCLRTDRGHDAAGLAARNGHGAVYELCRRHRRRTLLVAFERRSSRSTFTFGLHRRTECHRTYGVGAEGTDESIPPAEPTVTFISDGGHSYAVL